MTLPSRPIHPLSRRTLAAVWLGLLSAEAEARAQATWTVDPKASLAWWQMSPNLNHLWATTCPEDPSWRPGEGRSGGWSMSGLATSKGAAGVPDTVNVPLYPRWQARSICAEAVKGQVRAPDAVAWRGVRGEVVVSADALISGAEGRDAYTRQAILQTNRWPDIRFTLDSLVDVTQHGDTLRGTAVGVFTLRDVAKPMTAAVRAWPEAGGLRVLAKFRVLASAMVPEWGLPKFALGLGVGLNIFQDLFMGADLLLRREAAAKN